MSGYWDLCERSFISPRSNITYTHQITSPTLTLRVAHNMHPPSKTANSYPESCAPVHQIKLLFLRDHELLSPNTPKFLQKFGPSQNTRESSLHTKRSVWDKKRRREEEKREKRQEKLAYTIGAHIPFFLFFQNKERSMTRSSTKFPYTLAHIRSKAMSFPPRIRYLTWQHTQGKCAPHPYPWTPDISL